MSTGYLVSGATGFVGSALVLELLQRTDARIACLVRDNGHDPSHRLQAAIEGAATAFGYSAGSLPEHLHRLHVVVGDVTSDVRSVVPPPFEITEVWHSAASLRFADRDREEIFSTNVEGTRNLLSLARRLNVRVFNHVSTAYVAGRREGSIPEIPALSDHGTNNLYELSKIEAERLVASAADEFAVRIFRPSVVVGHSRTFATTSSTGLYGFIREMLRFRSKVESRLGSFLSMRPIRMIGDPDAPVNLIPVDHVARQAVALSLAASNAPIVHLTNRTPPTIGDVARVLFEYLGLRRPTFVESDRHFSSIDSEFDRGIHFYGSYLIGAKTFQQAACGSLGALQYSFSDDVTLKFIEWYVRQLTEIDREAVPEQARVAVQSARSG